MKNLNIQKFIDINAKQEKFRTDNPKRQKVEERSATQCSAILTTECNASK
jgi:hypothetical protein